MYSKIIPIVFFFLSNSLIFPRWLILSVFHFLFFNCLFIVVFPSRNWFFIRGVFFLPLFLYFLSLYSLYFLIVPFPCSTLFLVPSLACNLYLLVPCCLLTHRTGLFLLHWVSSSLKTQDGFSYWWGRRWNQHRRRWRRRKQTALGREQIFRRRMRGNDEHGESEGRNGWENKKEEKIKTREKLC